MTSLGQIELKYAMIKYVIFGIFCYVRPNNILTSGPEEVILSIRPPYVGANQIFMIPKRVVLYGRCHLWLTCHNRWEFGRVVNQLMGMSQHGSGDIGDRGNGNIVRFHHWYCPHAYCAGTWWRHQMETFSASLAICAGNSPVTGEFPAQRLVTRCFDVSFDLHPN